MCHPITTGTQSSQFNYERTLDGTLDNGPGSLLPAPIRLVWPNNNVARPFNSSIHQSSTNIDERTLQNNYFASSSDHVASHIGLPGSGRHTNLHFNSGFNAPINESVFTWDQHNEMTTPLVPGPFETSNFNGYDHLGSIWGSSTHVSGPALMNGGTSPPTNGFQFADAGELDHELSFPMQTPEATFMQGQLDGTYAWGDWACRRCSSSRRIRLPSAFCAQLSSPTICYHSLQLPHLRENVQEGLGSISPRVQRSFQDSRAASVSDRWVPEELWKGIQPRRQGDGASLEEARQSRPYEGLIYLLRGTLGSQRVRCCEPIGRAKKRAMSAAPVLFFIHESLCVSISCFRSFLHAWWACNHRGQCQLKFHLVIDVARPRTPSLNISGTGQVSGLPSQFTKMEF